jgi:DNA repair photolyase
MRWDHLRDRGDAPALFESGRTPLPLPPSAGALVRTVQTPTFRGMTFYEVRARSIINRVPEASRVPFRWTINPYRGCSHACTYCLSGETLVLLADGRSKPLRDVRIGDSVYGTVRIGNYLRYVPTEVLAHWRTTKRAYRIRLEDGTELIASGDHRFLTDEGWKYVTDGCGATQRPNLTVQNHLLGFGQPPDGPKHCDEYRAGYLSGILRRDGSIGACCYPRGSVTSRVYRFRLALSDKEVLHRAERFLAEAGIETARLEFGARQPMAAIRSSRRGTVERIHRLIEFPSQPSDQWERGFLAGIFDAGGSYSRGILRISNTNPRIIERITSSLAAFGFDFKVECKQRNGLKTVRILGGLPEHMRLFHLVDPAITRKREIVGVAVKSRARLRVVSIEPLGFDLPMYDITTGTGDFIANGMISHNCFARNTHTYLDLDYGEDFNSRVVVKINAAELLRKELAAPRWTGEHIAMGTNVDCYQRAEGRYRLMRGILGALRDHRNPFSILTKGTLILRDLDLLTEAGAVTEVSTNVSVGSVDRDNWRSIEPGTPQPGQRLRVCRTLNANGIACGVLMAPILPYLTDSPRHLERTVRAIAAADATHLSPIVLHLRTGAREWFFNWLAANHAELVPRYQELYRRGAYAPKAYQDEITGQVHELARRYGITGRRPAQTRGEGTSRLPSPLPRQEALL